ncbi:YicC/YloC family endoribonuclease [Teredinibacter haidensis]|uniref:YicC/YloC family endoribonuclease n=1 Tax=Teredinibacter haidensis TaxID=2731755 RepID=UPI000949183C|nr:YicC/YloC family endoribonuclease [Teredinibacter haidensis]
MPRSMTGFARQQAEHSWGQLSCEIRSVNHRYLEPSIRLSDALRAQETALREMLRKGVSRGKVEVSVHLKTEASNENDLALNQALTNQIAALAKQVSMQIDNPAQINPLEILRWPGVIQAAEINPDELAKAAVDLFSTTLSMLIENREREGEELKNFILQRLETIGKHVKVVREQLPELQAAYKEKLRGKVEALKIDVDEDRFNQEVVYVCQKSDVAEELDRLDAHIQEVTHTLKQEGPIGRRMDFLMQELNREANTLSSKSMSSETSQIAVDLKVLIEQMREQVQNIE